MKNSLDYFNEKVNNLLLIFTSFDAK